MVTRWGMSDALGPLQYAEPDEEVFLGYSVNRSRQMSNETAQAIDNEIRKLVEEGYVRAKHLLDEHRRPARERLPRRLLEYETLSGDEIKKVIAGEPIDRGGSKGPSLPAGRLVDTEGQAAQAGRDRRPRDGRRLVEDPECAHHQDEGGQHDDCDNEEHEGAPQCAPTTAAVSSAQLPVHVDRRHEQDEGRNGGDARPRSHYRARRAASMVMKASE